MINAITLLLIAAVAANNAANADPNEKLIKNGKVAIFDSELKLRSMIANANNRMDELKLEFLTQIKNVYLALKYDNPLEFNEAQKRAHLVARAKTEVERKWEKYLVLNNLEYQMPMVAQLMNEQYVSLLIKRYIVQRRLLKGLKFVSARLLPMETIVRLIQKYPKTYGWLQNESKLDLRIKFPGLDENQYSILYGLLELRAQIRAADDFIALSSDNIERILQSLQLYLVDNESHDELAGRDLDETERAFLAQFGKQMLDHYTQLATEEVTGLHQRYDQLMDEWADSIFSANEASAGEQDKVQQLTEFIDRFINVEMLDIDLSRAADSLSLPPTITEAIVQANVPKWIPAKVLKSLVEDRKLIMEHGHPIKEVISLPKAALNATDAKRYAEDDYYEYDLEDVDEFLAKRRGNRVDLARWAADASFFICKHGLNSFPQQVE